MSGPQGGDWKRLPINAPPSGTERMQRIVRPRFKFRDRQAAQAWAAEQDWYPRVWMGRTYGDARCWIWLLRE